jgi:hypothetical protein
VDIPSPFLVCAARMTRAALPFTWLLAPRRGY